MLLFLVVTVLVGAALPRLGVPVYAPARPFFAFFDPRLTWWSLPGAVVLVGIALLSPWTMRLSPAAFGLASAAVALMARVALNVARHGPAELTRPLDGRLAGDDYRAAIAVVRRDPANLLDRFPALVRHLPTHPSGHPPGATLLVAGMDAVGLSGARWEAALLIGAGALTAPLVYLLGRMLTGDSTARLAALVWAFAPSVLLESATSMDALFALVGTATLLALLADRRIAGAIGVAVGSFLSYTLLAVPALAGVIAWARGERRRVIAVLVVSGLGLGVFYLVLALGFGYEPLAAYQATKQRYLAGIGRLRPDAYWLFGDLAAFLIGLGLPTLFGFARSLRALAPAALALATVAVLAAASGYSRAEVERIWLFLTPLAAVAAAPYLRRWRLEPLLLVLAAQAMAVEILYGTVW